MKILEETDKENPWEGLQLTAEEKVFYRKFKEEFILYTAPDGEVKK